MELLASKVESGIEEPNRQIESLILKTRQLEAMIQELQADVNNQEAWISRPGEHQCKDDQNGQGADSPTQDIVI